MDNEVKFIDKQVWKKDSHATNDENIDLVIYGENMLLNRNSGNCINVRFVKTQK